MADERKREPLPESERVEHVEGAVVVLTPCCGARVFLPPDEAVPGAVLNPVCPRDGADWALELIAVEGGLRAVWAVPRAREGR